MTFFPHRVINTILIQMLPRKCGNACYFSQMWSLKCLLKGFCRHYYYIRCSDRICSWCGYSTADRFYGVSCSCWWRLQAVFVAAEFSASACSCCQGELLPFLRGFSYFLLFFRQPLLLLTVNSWELQYSCYQPYCRRWLMFLAVLLKIVSVVTLRVLKLLAVLLRVFTVVSCSAESFYSCQLFCQEFLLLLAVLLRVFNVYKCSAGDFTSVRYSAGGFAAIVSCSAGSCCSCQLSRWVLLPLSAALAVVHVANCHVEGCYCCQLRQRLFMLLAGLLWGCSSVSLFLQGIFTADKPSNESYYSTVVWGFPSRSNSTGIGHCLS